MKNFLMLEKTQKAAGHDRQLWETEMKTAVLGYGTVGKGVYEMLRSAKDLEQGPVLVRKGKADEPWKTDDFDAVLADDSLNAVAEAIGGIDPAFDYAMKTLKAGKHFVTANKALVAEKGSELQAAADESGAAFLFSAACGGGVPLLHNLALSRRGDRILKVSGILNGTTNYMLDRMQRFGTDYEAALKMAQEMGYAEADPSADVSGLDALRKIILAAGTAFGILPSGGLHEGIESFTAEDIRFYQSKGLVLRLIAQTERTAGGVSCFTEPVLFPDNAPEAAVLENNNLASYEGRCCGKISLMGQGAGRYPTASALIRDLESVLSGERRMFPEGLKQAEADHDSVKRRYLVRLPEEAKEQLPCDEVQGKEGAYLRILTGTIPVNRMHEAARKIREKGGRIAFAALEE